MDKIRAGLQKALAFGGHSYTVEDVLDLIQRGHARVWREGNSVIITQDVEESGVREMHIWLATGDLRSVVALSRRVVEAAREEGCARVTVIGRPGWARIAAKEGWETRPVLYMQKELTSG